MTDLLNAFFRAGLTRNDARPHPTLSIVGGSGPPDLDMSHTANTNMASNGTPPLAAPIQQNRGLSYNDPNPLVSNYGPYQQSLNGNNSGTATGMGTSTQIIGSGQSNVPLTAAPTGSGGMGSKGSF